MGELIDTLDLIDFSVSVDVACWSDLVSSQVVVSNEVLSWLVDIETVWQLLSSQKESKGITSIILVVNLSNLDSVVSEVVVNNIWEFVADCEETKNLTIVVKELLL